jgi:uncharacterized phage protein (TIGR02218 family)
MAHDTRESLQSLLDGQTLRVTRIYRITRRDGTVLRLTDHDEEIVCREGYLDGSADSLSGDYTYTPAVGVFGSAIRQEAALKPQSMEIEGLIDSALITDAELRAGVYQNAIVDIAYCDWQYPWLGFFRHNEYRITDFEYDEERWTATVVNKASELQRKIGKRWSRTCWHTFMDEGCGIAQTPGTTTFPGQQLSNLDPSKPTTRFSFIPGATYDGTLEVDSFYKGGHLRFTTGANAGQSYPIYKSEAGVPLSFDPHILELQYPTRAAMVAGDLFTLFAGCERTIQACQSTTLAGGVDNHLRFGGAPDMPGTGRVAQGGSTYRV